MVNASDSANRFLRSVVDMADDTLMQEVFPGNTYVSSNSKPSSLPNEPLPLRAQVSAPRKGFCQAMERSYMPSLATIFCDTRHSGNKDVFVPLVTGEPTRSDTSWNFANNLNYVYLMSAHATQYRLLAIRGGSQLPSFHHSSGE